MIYTEYCGFAILYYFIRLLPLKLAYMLARGLFSILFLIERKHKNRSIQHLMHAGIAKDETEAREIAKKFFASFAMLLVEVVKLDQCYDPAKVTVAGNLENARRFWPGNGVKGDQAIIITAHYGNWEVAGMNWTVKSAGNLTSIMRKFDNPLIGEMILKHRRSEHHKLVDKKGGIRDVLRALKNGESVAILTDQHAGGSDGVETVFFGHPCMTHASPAQLHLKTGIPLLPYLTRRKAGDNFEFEGVFGDIIEYTPTGNREKDVAAVAQLYTSGLEKLIAEQPEQWLWAHRRWTDINRRKKDRNGKKTGGNTTEGESGSTQEENKK